MLLRPKIFILLLLGTFVTLDAQVITVNPVFPTSSDAVVITFNADKGNMGLKDYAGDDVYAHTGVITDQSSGGWKYVVAEWGTNLPKAKLIKVSANVYTLTISPSIREFYGVPADEKILKLAFVFRNSGGSVTGRDVGGTDIFYDVTEAATFQLMLSQPDSYTSLVNTGQVIPVQASASVCDSMILLQNNVRVTKVTTTTLAHDITAAGSGNFKLIVMAWYNNVMKSDSAFYFIRTPAVTEAVPAGLKPGVNVTGDNSATFLIYAPGKSTVFVMGDFNGWLYCNEGFMKKSPDGYWFWLAISGLDPAKEYGFQYMIDESIRIPDPYATKVLDPANDKYIDAATYPDLKPYPEGKADGLVAVFQTRPAQYVWDHSTFTPPAKDDLIIYELLVRDFVALHDFKTIRDSLDYLDRLGVNAIEFMPVNEFEGNNSWGYNPSMYFAVDKYYGKSDSFKELIDSCHGRGIAVIMDMVVNHAYGSNPLVRMYFNTSTNQPAANNPWFNVSAPHTAFSWGYDFNHQSISTQEFVDSVCHYWISEFKVDGFRFDFTKGFTNTPTNNDGTMSAYDPSRIAVIKRIGDKIWSYKPDAALILEHFSGNTEEMELASYGFLLWGDGKWRYQEASKGNSADLSEASWKNLGWSVPGVLDYMESHDQERIMYLNMTNGQAVTGYNIRDFKTALKRVKLTATFCLTIPGPKMLWHFQELGYDYAYNYNNDPLGPKPIRWDYYTDPDRKNLYNNFAALIELKKSNPAFSSDNYSLYQVGKAKRVNIQNSDMDVVVLGNFDLTPQTIDPNFTKTGTWYEFFQGTTLEVTAASQNTPISLLQGEYRLYTSKLVSRPSFLTGVEDQSADDNNASLLFDVFPNPFAEETQIRFTGEDAYQPHTVEIFSTDGVRVRIIACPAGISEVPLDGAGFAAGIYYIRVTSGKLHSVKKIIRL
ncbi:MAG: alpha-amylase family glycosyl hydrolase [Bacteroidales bacterium]